MLAELNFDVLLSEKLKMLGNVTEMVFSTCSNNRVTSRVVSTSCQGSKIYFLSWDHHTKCQQIRENPYVAFCYETLQIEGIATIKGDPSAQKNLPCTEKYKEKQEHLFTNFTKFSGMVLVEVDIKFITSYPRDGGNYYLDHIDVDKKIAYREAMEKIN